MTDAEMTSLFRKERIPSRDLADKALRAGLRSLMLLPNINNRHFRHPLDAKEK
jgi:hypothetical protein